MMTDLNKASYGVGDRVSWGSSGGTARGIIRSIHRDGAVPNIPVKITGSEDAPAARIELVDDEGEPRGEYVGHKLDTLRKGIFEKALYQGKEVSLDKPFRLPAGSTKKFGVYVKSGDGVKKVTFGDPNMSIRRDNPEARANFRARHSCDTATDKTTARYWSCRFWSDEPVSEMTKSADELSQILKFDDEQRVIYGFASVVSVNGEPLVDLHGDVISSKTMEKAATEFMLGTRKGLTMHSGDQTTTIVHSMPLTKEVMDALGISSEKEGWAIAVKVHDDQTWQDAKGGKFTGFSIGGRARKVALD